MALTTIFDNDVPVVPMPRKVKASSTGFPAYGGASLSRLNADWIGSLLSPDQEIRGSLKRLRARCRQLHNNNDYAQRFTELLKKNVVGPSGFQLEAQVESADGTLDEATNEELERVWSEFCKVGNTTCDGRLGFRDVCNVGMESLAIDGEIFLHCVKGYPDNKFGFALQFFDPDQVDVLFNRPRTETPDGVSNEVRMGVEVNGWNRPVAFWILNSHPAEGGTRRSRIAAQDIIHVYIFRRAGQNRGVPWMNTAMSRLNQLGGYEEAELVAARAAACKMGFVTSKTGEDEVGRQDGSSDAVVMDVQPMTLEQLPADMDIKTIDWQHPNSNFGEFVKAMLRGAAMGIGLSYTSLAGDLREVNFSSIRQGILDERDGYRVLQAMWIEHVCQPVFERFLPMAILSGQTDLDVTRLEEYCAAVRWQPRGFAWVDPYKDITAMMAARGAGMGSLADACSQLGKDWRDVIDQIAVENEYAKKKGVDLNFAVQKNIAGKPAAAPEPNAPNVPEDEGEQEDGGN